MMLFADLLGVTSTGWISAALMLFTAVYVLVNLTIKKRKTSHNSFTHTHTFHLYDIFIFLFSLIKQLSKVAKLSSMGRKNP